jgi:nucleoid-associated protein YgaU
VAAGDSFWSIAARTEAQRLGRPPSPAEVGAYWVKLKAANQARLARRGDYDLVLPGQVLSLPEG